MALNTGKKITRRSWDVIPMPDTVITRVNALGSDQPEQLVFTDRHGRLIGDIEIPGVDSEEADNVADDTEIPGVDPAAVDNVELPGVDVEGQENHAPQEMLRLMISTFQHQIQILLKWNHQLRSRQLTKWKFQPRQKRQHQS